MISNCYISFNWYQKKGQATYIASLQPLTLATFRSWGNSAGADRIRLARTANLRKKKRFWQYHFTDMPVPLKILFLIHKAITL